MCIEISRLTPFISVRIPLLVLRTPSGRTGSPDCPEQGLRVEGSKRTGNNTIAQSVLEEYIQLSFNIIQILHKFNFFPTHHE
jgi:hypothetical protein